MPRSKLNKQILNFNLYLVLISSQSESPKLASSLPSSQPKLLLDSYLYIQKCRTKYRVEHITNLASRHLTNKNDCYPSLTVHQRTRVKPHPHLGLQRLQRLDATRNLQRHKARNSVPRNRQEKIYFKRPHRKRHHLRVKPRPCYDRQQLQRLEVGHAQHLRLVNHLVCPQIQSL